MAEVTRAEFDSLVADVRRIEETQVKLRHIVFPRITTPTSGAKIGKTLHVEGVTFAGYHTEIHSWTGDRYNGNMGHAPVKDNTFAVDIDTTDWPHGDCQIAAVCYPGMTGVDRVESDKISITIIE